MYSMFSRVTQQQENTENVYDCFQVTTWDWTRAEKSFTVYEIMFKILKVRALLFISRGGFRRAGKTDRVRGFTAAPTVRFY